MTLLPKEKVSFYSSTYNTTKATTTGHTNKRKKETESQVINLISKTPKLKKLTDKTTYHNQPTKLITMLFNSRALVSVLLLISGADAFKPANRNNSNKATQLKKDLANIVAVGVVSAATLLPFAAPAVAAGDSLVMGTPLETKLANFGAASYPVFNSITDVSPLADKFVDFLEKKVKAPDAADVATKAVDGLLAIPNDSINEYKGVLKQVVYSGVNKDSCVTLGGSGAAAKKLASSAAIKSVDPAKIDALTKKFQVRLIIT